MALPPLAATADLTARGIDTSDSDAVEAFLASASTSVREAAGSPITQESSTVTLPGTLDFWLRLPGGPVTDVTSVEIDGETVDDWRWSGEYLWRPHGWQPKGRPTQVTVTYDHGLIAAPADIVDLVCSLVGLALARKAEGYESRGHLTSLAIDDYRESYLSGDNAQAGLFALPQRTRNSLRSRFGGNGWAG